MTRFLVPESGSFAEALLRPSHVANWCCLEVVSFPLSIIKPLWSGGHCHAWDWSWPLAGKRQSDLINQWLCGWHCLITRTASDISSGDDFCTYQPLLYCFSSSCKVDFFCSTCLTPKSVWKLSMEKFLIRSDWLVKSCCSVGSTMCEWTCLHPLLYCCSSNSWMHRKTRWEGWYWCYWQSYVSSSLRWLIIHGILSSNDYCSSSLMSVLKNGSMMLLSIFHNVEHFHSYDCDLELFLAERTMRR